MGELDHIEGWLTKNWCFWTVVLEKTLESSLDSKIKPVHPKGNQADAEAPIPGATWCKELTHWRRPWCWERLKAGREGGDRGWDGWMALPTQWTWVWANSERWWRTGMLHVAVHGAEKSGTQLRDWTTTTALNLALFYLLGVTTYCIITSAP